MSTAQGDYLKKVKPWRFLFLAISLLACSYFSLSQDSQELANIHTATPEFDSGSRSASGFDAWSLWSQGTQLRGANIYQRPVYLELDGEEFLGTGSFGPPFTQADIDALSELGANYVNISHSGLFTVQPPYVVDQAAVDNLDNLLEMIAQADMFAVITFRSGPGRSEFSILRDGLGTWFDEEYLIETVWVDQAAKAAWADMWEFTAQRYRDNPIVVGYDIMCEPNSNAILDIWNPNAFHRVYADTGYDWNTWYPSIVAAIRAVDPDMPVLVGGNGYSGPEWLPYLEPVEVERIVYTFHQYFPHVYTHQEFPLLNTYPGSFDMDYDDQLDDFNREWLQDWLSIPADYAEEQNITLAVNEYGVVRWEPGAAEFMRDQMEIFEGYGWNYALWAWEPTWEAWEQNVTEFNYRFGPDPESATVIDNALQSLITDFWARNTIRPSDIARKIDLSLAGKLEDVTRWFYFIGDIPDDATVDKIVASDYDLVVLDNIPSVVGDEDYPMKKLIDRLHATDKLVLAYIDIGEAEDYRTYWKSNWKIGDPEWITSADPDGWEGNFPVAYWYDEWQEIWLANDGLLSEILNFGFDGVYLDWVEAYSDDNVANFAENEGLDPVQEMIWFVGDISDFIKKRCPACLVVAQNAAELINHDDYVEKIDAIAQEQVWFDGGADNKPQGDCALPRTDAEIDTDDYYQSLSVVCQRQFDEFPDNTLHVSSQEYLYYLDMAKQKGLPVFTVDYALDPENVTWVYQTARDLGFIPFVSNRGLDRYIDPVP